jgi:hypothetical protein
METTDLLLSTAAVADVVTRLLLEKPDMIQAFLWKNPQLLCEVVLAENEFPIGNSFLKNPDLLKSIFMGDSDLLKKTIQIDMPELLEFAETTAVYKKQLNDFCTGTTGVSIAVGQRRRTRRHAHASEVGSRRRSRK